MVMWVCEAWQVNIWTVFAVRPNGPNNNNNNNNKNNFASSRSDHLGSDNKLDRFTIRLASLVDLKKFNEETDYQSFCLIAFCISMKKF